LIFGVVRKAVETKRMPEEALRQDITKILESLKLSVDGELNNATIALFGTEFLPYYPQCQLKTARFKGIDRAEFLDSDLNYGNIFDLLEKGMLFVKRHLPIAAKIEPGNIERVETPLIPFNAIREALINALAHRDYSSVGGAIGLAIYDDRMEIFNDGGLLPGVTLQQIKSGRSKPGNPIIADVLYRSNLIEKWGRGIQTMIRNCLEAEDPEPEFLVNNSEFKVIFKFPTSLSPIQVAGKELGEMEELTHRQQGIVGALAKAGALSSQELLNVLEPSPAKRTLQLELSKLKKKGIIQLKGYAQSAVWVISTDPQKKG